MVSDNPAIKLARFMRDQRDQYASEFPPTAAGELALQQRLAQVRANWLEVFVPVALHARVWRMAKALLGVAA